MSIVRPSTLRWVMSNMAGFAFAGLLIRILVPATALVSGMIGLAGGPGMLLAALTQVPDLILWQSVLVAAAMAGMLSGAIVGGITGFTQGWVLGWQGRWVEASLKGGILGGLFAGLFCGVIANAAGYGWDIGLPLDWIFRRSAVGALALASMGGIMGYVLGLYQQRMLEEAGYIAHGWARRSAVYGVVAWGLSGIYGETLLGIMGTAPQTVTLDFGPDKSAIGEMRSAFEPHLAAVANLMMIGMSYGAMSAGRIRAILENAANEPVQVRRILSGRVLFFVLVGCGVVQIVTMVVAIVLSQSGT